MYLFLPGNKRLPLLINTALMTLYNIPSSSVSRLMTVTTTVGPIEETKIMLEVLGKSRCQKQTD